MTPTDHTNSVTALRSADAVNPNMRTPQKSNDIIFFDVSKEIFNCSTYCITKLILYNANLLYESCVNLEIGIRHVAINTPTPNQSTNPSAQNSKLENNALDTYLFSKLKIDAFNIASFWR